MNRGGKSGQIEAVERLRVRAMAAQMKTPQQTSRSMTVEVRTPS